MTANPFVEWFVKHYGKADTPVGDLARDLKGAYGVPGSGDLRGYLEDIGAEQWALNAYDEAWTAYQSVPTCSSPGCIAKAAGGSSCFCPAHGGRSHHSDLL